MATSLDDRDMRILSILSSESRMPNTELARRVNPPVTPCRERLTRLDGAGPALGRRRT